LHLDFLRARAKIFILALFFCLTPLYLLEQNNLAAAAAFLLLVGISLFYKSNKVKLVWLIFAVSFFYFGSLTLFVLTTVFIFCKVSNRLSIVFLLTNAVSFLIYQHWLVSFSEDEISFLKLSLGSAAFLITQLFSLIVLLIFVKSFKAVGIIIALATLIWFLLSLLTFGAWLSVDVFTSRPFRIVPGVFLAIAVSAIAKPYLLDRLDGKDELNIKIYPIAFFTAFMMVLAGSYITKEPIEHIIFDESHGHWETTKNAYGPDDFGRNFTYTYSVLYKYAEKLTKQVSRYEGGDLPVSGSRALFILKMPTEPISSVFTQKLVKWVEEGGHLLVVADHTNLFDTTLHLNPILRQLSNIRLASNANFNEVGRPTTAQDGYAGLLAGKILGVTNGFPYMTGTGFSDIPFSALVVGSYGNSFMEDAVYFRANRFGYFNPSLNFAFGNHPSAVIIGQKKGVVTVIGDSTPWSNFAIFHGQYFDLFRSILAINAYSGIYQIYYFALVGIIIALFLLVLMPFKVFQLIGTVICGIYFGSVVFVSGAGLTKSTVGRDYSINVALGEGANAENLTQLVPTGEHNFARALATFPKYGLTPRLILGKEATFNKSDPVTLYINPDPKLLPSLSELINYIELGGRINILFSREQAKNPEIKKWIGSLSMRLVNHKSLGMIEGMNDSLNDRLGIEIVKIIRHKVVALPSSYFIEESNQNFYQAFRLQGAPLDKIDSYGHLVIGFDSEAISDAVVGEIWEGTIPSLLSKQRERQISMMATSRFVDKAQFGSEQRKIASNNLKVPLRKFIIAKDSSKIMSGDIVLSSKAEVPDSLGDNPDLYLAKLQSDVLLFIENNCKEIDSNKFCKKTFISHDLVEWSVTYSKANNNIIAVELVHDPRFAGLKSNYNIIFLKN
jgi:hypothetical protein